MNTSRANLLTITAGVASMLLGLARTAREWQWDWFVLVLALGPLGTLLYGLRRTTGETAPY